MRKKIAEPRWRFIERVVAVLQKMLLPDAIVQYDQKISEVDTNTLRQCDVIVRLGANQVLDAIVEVQDRIEKVGLQTYDGWCRKRDKLGARRLICVSRKGYTKAVALHSEIEGKSVVLMTLVEPDEPPPLLAGTEFILDMEVLLYRDANVVFLDKRPSSQHQCNDKVFEFSNRTGRRVSLFWLGDHALKNGQATDVGVRPTSENEKEIRYRVSLENLPYTLSLEEDGVIYRVSEVRFTDRIQMKRESLPRKILAYETQRRDGKIALILFGESSYEGQTFYCAQTLKLDADGRVIPLPFQISKIPGLSFSSVASEFLVPTNPAQDN